MKQKFKLENQRNKHSIKLFTNVRYANPWLHGMYRNSTFFLATLKQAYRDQ